MVTLMTAVLCRRTAFSIQSVGVLRKLSQQQSCRCFYKIQIPLKHQFNFPIVPLKTHKTQILKSILFNNIVNQRAFTTHVKNECQQVASGSPSKKRPPRKKSKSLMKDEWTVVALSTAEEYDLEMLDEDLKKRGIYQQTSMPEDLHNVLHISAKYQIDAEPREIYFFREGSVVFWNVPEIERHEVLKMLRSHETNSYQEDVIKEESEVMEYMYSTNKTGLVNGKILLNAANSTDLDKYTFSNGVALSVKLALWESSLDKYGESIEWITEDMRAGKKVKITQDQVFRKTGELYTLRHDINLSSDLLDTPDFYWDRQDLENLYHRTCNYFSIAKRTKIMNEKLNYCCELMELLSHHLSDKHHVRLELMIIALILVEVVFEFLHYLSNGTEYSDSSEGKKVVL